MSQTTLEPVLELALTLSAEDRRRLIEELFQSLPSMPAETVDRAWREEVSRRLAQIDNGSVELLSWETVSQQIESRWNAN
jgi:putative addiction module component (TIGR02574 family)